MPSVPSCKARRTVPTEPLQARYPWLVATLSRRDVEHVAHLARLGLSDEEVIQLEDQLNHILRTVDRVAPETELRERLEEGKPLRVKLGVDPTAPDVHLGWAVVLDLLRRFQVTTFEILIEFIIKFIKGCTTCEEQE